MGGNRHIPWGALAVGVGLSAGGALFAESVTACLPIVGGSFVAMIVAIFWKRSGPASPLRHEPILFGSAPDPARSRMVSEGQRIIRPLHRFRLALDAVQASLGDAADAMRRNDAIALERSSRGASLAWRDARRSFASVQREMGRKTISQHTAAPLESIMVAAEGAVEDLKATLAKCSAGICLEFKFVPEGASAPGCSIACTPAMVEKIVIHLAGAAVDRILKSRAARGQVTVRVEAIPKCNPVQVVLWVEDSGPALRVSEAAQFLSEHDSNHSLSGQILELVGGGVRLDYHRPSGDFDPVRFSATFQAEGLP